MACNPFPLRRTLNSAGSARYLILHRQTGRRQRFFKRAVANCPHHPPSSTRNEEAMVCGSVTAPSGRARSRPARRRARPVRQTSAGVRAEYLPGRANRAGAHCRGPTRVVRRSRYRHRHSATSASASAQFTASCQARTTSNRSRFIALASAIARFLPSSGSVAPRHRVL